MGKQGVPPDDPGKVGGNRVSHLRGKQGVPPDDPGKSVGKQGVTISTKFALRVYLYLLVVSFRYYGTACLSTHTLNSLIQIDR